LLPIEKQIDVIRMNNAKPPRQWTVDGESWEISERDGQYDFKWLTGVAAGYGFTARLSDPHFTFSREDIERMIREFMGNVNPETGYLD
jgi:hypothetical protein